MKIFTDYCNLSYFLLLQQVTFYGSSLTPGEKPPEGAPVTVEGLDTPAIVHSGGMTLTGTDYKMVSLYLQTEVYCFKMHLRNCQNYRLVDAQRESCPTT